MSWGLYGIIVTQMGDLNESLSLTDGTTTTIKAYLYDTYHYEYSFRWPVSNSTKAHLPFGYNSSSWALRS